MLKARTQNDLARMKIVANGIREVAAELRLIEVGDLIAYIHGEQFATIEDLVNSSAELFFKEGTLSFAWAAALDVTWGAPPSVLIDMEFHHKSVSAFFTLALRHDYGTIDLKHVWFAAPPHSDDDETERLGDAFSDARLVPMRADALDGSVR